MILKEKCLDKKHVFKQIEEYLNQNNVTALSSDLSRPWGGFFVIDPGCLEQFAHQFFQEKKTLNQNNKLTLSPKVLVVAPDKRLSWQYHHRRSEIWSVLRGPVGVIKSDDNTQGELIILNDKDQIELQKGERHRLIGLNDWGIVAEIWQHSDPNHPSDEEDIVRLEDDFGR